MSKLPYANVSNPHVNALVTGRYRFEHEGVAKQKMEFFRKSFIIAKQDATADIPESKDVLVMWIRDYAIASEELEQGFLGNYAFVTPEQMDNGIYTLACIKLECELKHHPRRTRKKTTLPNWGHPILRSVKKGKHYPTLEAIQAECDALHIEYPQTTIPGNNSLYLMIFDRKDDPKEPAQKYVLNIVANKEKGGFNFEYKKNTFEGNLALPKESNVKKMQKDEVTQLTSGYFASMVTLKRKKKSAIKPKTLSKTPAIKQDGMDSNE